MKPATLRDAALHDKAERLRYAYGEQLLALEEKFVGEDERCCDAGRLAAAVLDAAAHGDRKTLADFGLDCPGEGPVSDDELGMAFAAHLNQ